MKSDFPPRGKRSNSIGRRRGLFARRRAAAAVEFSLVAPIIFLMVFASVEFGRALMVMHAVADAARDGCRIAVAWKATVPQVEEVVAERLRTFGVTTYRLTVEPSNLDAAEQFEPVTVHITAAYQDVSYLPIPNLLSGATLSGHCCLPKEGEVVRKRN